MITSRVSSSTTGIGVAANDGTSFESDEQAARVRASTPNKISFVSLFVIVFTRFVYLELLLNAHLLHMKCIDSILRDGIELIKIS